MTLPSIFPIHPMQGFSDAISRIRTSVADRYKTRRAYNRTFRELSAMSERELTDIGLIQEDIRRISAEIAATM